MRLFEILIVLLDLPLVVVACASHASPGWIYGLPLVAILVIVLHWFVEGYRWQMAPAYIGSVLLAVCVLIRNGQHSEMGMVITAAVLLFASLVLATILPVFSLPEPGGPNGIGTITRQWTVREDFGRTDQSLPRKLNIQFWYPTDATRGKRSPYRTADAQGLKAHLRLTRTHSIVNAPVSREHPQYPVVLFSPGWKGHLTQNSIQFEMLASYGFIVLAMEHPTAETLPLYFDPSREENLRGYAVEVTRRALDVQFVLDQLEKLNQRDPDERFTNLLDLSRIGMFGYSFGGALSAEACCLDQRIKAGINMDGMMFGEVTRTGVRQPFLFISDDSGGPSERDLHSPDPGRQIHARALQADCQLIDRSLAQYGGYYLRIRGAAHSNFSDRPLYSPSKRLTDAGPIDVPTCIQIINAYTLAFFEQHLNRNVQPLLNGTNSNYPEAVFRYHGVPVALDPPLATIASAS
jgi:predicted dienelactone hydrolase